MFGCLTTEGHLGEHKYIKFVKLLLISLGQHSIGAAEVVSDIANLGRELKTADSGHFYVVSAVCERSWKG